MVLADSHNGYFQNFQGYTGKVNNTAEKGLGAHVVKDLTSDLKGKYHHAFFDNYLTSVDLLTSRKTAFMLVVRPGRTGKGSLKH